MSNAARDERKMSRVELYEVIRREVKLEGRSIRETARKHNVHRRTVREALACSVPPERKIVAIRRPKLAEHEATIRQWLSEDLDVHRKQRHTATRIWQRLSDEHGADVSQSSVRVLVAKLRSEIGNAPTAMVPQIHLPGGEAEVDFGDVYIYVGDEKLKAKLFVMRLCNSGKAFHRVYASESQECFFDGHEKAFLAFEGIPGTIRYDNLTSAVTKVLLGRNRKENERFIAFRSHYGFASSFCTPGIDGAHEKGGVEGEVKRCRRRYFVPTPRGASLSIINERLNAKVDRDDATRHIDGRRTTVEADFASEKAHLMALVEEPFGTARILFAKVDTKSRVSVRNCRYSVPVSLIGKSLQIALSADTVSISYASKTVAVHQRLLHRGDSSLNLDHYLEALSYKPRAFASSLPLHQAKHNGTFWPEHEAFLKSAKIKTSESKATIELIEVLLLSRRMPKEAIVAGIEKALAINCPTASYVEIAAREYLEPPKAPSIDRYPEIICALTSLEGYNALLSAGVNS